MLQHLSQKGSATQNLIWIGVLGLLLVVVGCQPSTPAATPVPPTITPFPTTAPVATNVPGVTPQPTPPTVDWLNVYFTDASLINADRSNGFDQVVVQAINEAQSEIDIASFDFNLKSVVDALIAAQKRGVKVRLVLDLKNGSTTVRASASQKIEAYDAIADLDKAKIPYVDGGRSSGLMHNKIVILDRKTLFIGSWNLSFNDTFKNDNNVLRISDPLLIANYQAKFNEMFLEKRFGRQAKVGALQPSMTVQGTAIEMYFAPIDDVMSKVIAEVQKSRRSIRFMIFTFTYPELTAAMIERFQKGVTVEGVIENRGASQGALPELFCAKIPVKREAGGGTMHHKVLIIDNQTVITGSFNFTKSATTQNDENLIIIRNPRVVSLYLKEFQRIMSRSLEPTGIECSQ